MSRARKTSTYTFVHVWKSTISTASLVVHTYIKWNVRETKDIISEIIKRSLYYELQFLIFLGFTLPKDRPINIVITALYFSKFLWWRGDIITLSKTVFIQG